MTIHEIHTSLTPAEVIRRAAAFFALAGSPSAAFPERLGAGSIKLHIEVGEIVIAAQERDGFTLIRGSASRALPLLTRFLSTLAPPLDLRQTEHRRGVTRTSGARVETIDGAAASTELPAISSAA